MTKRRASGWWGLIMNQSNLSNKRIGGGRGVAERPGRSTIFIPKVFNS